MKAMLWKELRENLKWGVLAMIGLGMAEIYGLNYYDPMNYNNRGITLCNPTFLMATSFGCALVGLLLGLLQILPEQRRDQWAALLHRPVPRDVIFRGKVVAGVALYLLATIVPFLVCVWLAATPGHFVAPFVPSLILPGVADIMTGLAYYFAGLLVALQRGSWFGARTMALFAAVHLSFFVVSAKNNGPSYFYVAVEAAVLMAIALFAAGWGAMRSNGPFHVRPWLARVALLAAVFYGIFGICDLARTLLNSGGQQSPFIGSQYQITRDGQPIIITVSEDLSPKVTDLAGNVIKDDRYVGRHAYENYMSLEEVSVLIGDTHGYDPVQRYYQYRESGRYVQEVELNSFYSLPVTWFYLEEKKYFVGMSNRGKSRVEIADNSGFKPPQAVPEPFPNINGFVNTYGVPCLVPTGNTVLAFNFEHEQLFELPGTDEGKIYGAQLVQFRTKAAPGYDQVIALAFANEMRVYDLKGNPLATLPYHQADLDHFGLIALGVDEDRSHYFVEYEPSIWMDWRVRNQMPSYLEEVDAQGTVVHSYNLPALPMRSTPQKWIDYLGDDGKSPAFWYGNLSYQEIGGLLGVKRLGDKAQTAFGSNWAHVRELSIRLTLYSLFFAIVALAWARRAQFPWKRAVAWAAFVFAFNLAGLITFRLVADWPVRVKCPQCSRKRPVEKELCPHCGAPWPKRATRGTEIFDQEEVPARSAQLAG